MKENTVVREMKTIVCIVFKMDVRIMYGNAKLLHKQLIWTALIVTAAFSVSSVFNSTSENPTGVSTLTPPIFPCVALCSKRSVYHSREMYKPKHQCYHHECPSCLEYVDLSTHRCYIQTEEQMQERYAQCRQRRQQLADQRALAHGYNP